MSLNSTPSGERIHIAFFGRRNAGKSSLVNAFTGQSLSIVSDIRGTTTDPVYKAMELLPLGPVMIIDTPGIDDEGVLGELRVKKTHQVLNKTDIAVIVCEAGAPMNPAEEKLIGLIRAKNIPYIIAWNKSDLISKVPDRDDNSVWVSALNGSSISELKETVAHMISDSNSRKPLVSDILSAGDLAVLVVPIDKAAPKGRLILPQQLVIRDALEAGAAPVVIRDTELEAVLSKIQTPRIVITDSQVFGHVAKIVPDDVLLTSFSILMARFKGDLSLQVEGAKKIEALRDGDKILIAEGCTHHRQCGDIGTQKLPRWISEYTGVNPEFYFCSGTEFPEELTPYSLIVHCGGCMLNEREMKYRLRSAVDQGVKVTNYGTLIAYINGILPRTLAPFPEQYTILYK